ncbi:MAG: hypothetical protein M3Q30_28250 [Actinomycetota bacterium]|nr:hypothetical protein [Actinomycetota bacterium]
MVRISARAGGSSPQRSLLGYTELRVQERRRPLRSGRSLDLSIYRGAPATSAAHIAFDARGRGAVDAFFDAAIENGATARGEPGSGRSTPRAITRRS